MSEQFMNHVDMNDVTGEQVERYVQLMRDITHAVARGAKTRYTHRMLQGNEIIDVNPKEFWLPGMYSDWVVDDETGHVQQERVRSVAASWLGGTASRLVVIENDSKRFTDYNGEDKYHSSRRIYKIGRDNDGNVVESQMTEQEIESVARIDAEVHDTEIDMAKLWLDPEETDSHEEAIELSGPLTAGAFEGLRVRTEAYGRDYARNKAEVPMKASNR